MIWDHDVVCPTCSASVAVRINRNGFWQRQVLSRLGLYPWKCGACGSTFLYKRRGRNHHHSSEHSHGSGRAGSRHDHA